MSISAFFYRDFCYNGCVFGKTDAFEYKRVHLGGTLIEGEGFEILSDKSKKLEDVIIVDRNANALGDYRSMFDPSTASRAKWHYYPSLSDYVDGDVH